jgi:hypothetical protein
MARFEGPPNSAHRPATTPVEGPHGRWPTVVAVLVLAGVTFMVGLHLGEAEVSPSVVLPSGSVQGSPAPTITPPPVQPDAVSSALANAAGGIAPRYGWAICVVDATPTCQSIGPVTVSYNDFAGTAGPLSSPMWSLVDVVRDVRLEHSFEVPTTVDQGLYETQGGSVVRSVLRSRAVTRVRTARIRTGSP